MNIPDNLKYTKHHEWIQVDGNVATTGVTDYAQEQLGDIVYVELPQKDAEVARGDTFGVLESVKAVSDCYMPLSGKIADVNDTLGENPELVNEDCYGEGWIVRIELSNTEELGNLMDHAQYELFVKEETA